MPVLSNPRHERFAQELASGKSATEAYVTAGFKPNRHNACRLKTNEHIENRVAELQGGTAEEFILNRQFVLDRLKQNLDRAMQLREGAVANKALELLGKEIGMFVERKEVGPPGSFVALLPEKTETAEEWVQQLNGSSPQSSGGPKPVPRPN